MDHHQDIQSGFGAGEMSNQNETRNPAGMTPSAGMAVSFLVLLDGVIQGDTTKVGADEMYRTAAVTLALSGVAYWFHTSDALRDPARPRIVGPEEDLAERISYQFLRVISVLGIQFLILLLAFQICSRAGFVAKQAFILTLMFSMLGFGALTMLLRFTSVISRIAAIALARRSWVVPRWLNWLSQLNEPLYINSKDNTKTEDDSNLKSSKE